MKTNILSKMDLWGILASIMVRKKQNLSLAVEVFDGVRTQMKGILDDPVKLIEFLGVHLKPKELEKKVRGEVFTPVWFVNEMLDKLEEIDPTIWSNPLNKFLDPANGIGNYPAMVFQRLMTGLETSIPNVGDRKKHILENMLYMCELDAKNVEVSRKLFDPDGIYKLNLYNGNALEVDVSAMWGLDMKYIYVIGNPPYNTERSRSGCSPLYHKFIEKFIDNCRMLMFVVPSRWFSGGKGLDKFRKMMLSRNDIRFIKHFQNEKDVFGNAVSIEGGVNYFLKDTKYTGLCEFNDIPICLADFDVIVDSKYTSILSKVTSHQSLESIYIGRAFSIESNDKRLCDDATQVKCYVSKQKGFQKYIKKECIKRDYDFWKVITARANGKYKRFGNTFIGSPTEVHTGSYISFKVASKEEAESLASYMKTKLPNVLLGLRKCSQDINGNTCKWIPLPPLDRNWDNESVNKFFKLTEDEIELIETT